jgi:hypothetical protein
MSQRIERKRFHDVDWRVVRDDASTHFRTGSFAAGVALVDAIGTLADAAVKRGELVASVVDGSACFPAGGMHA